MNLVTLKCQYLNGNNLVISASIMKFLPFWIDLPELNFSSICTTLFLTALTRISSELAIEYFSEN
jgi:hypothetical protein